MKIENSKYLNDEDNKYKKFNAVIKLFEDKEGE